MGSIQDFSGRLARFVESQHIKIYDDQLAIASQIWDGLSSEERKVPKVIEYITLGVFREMDRVTGLESTKRMIHVEVQVDERLIPQIKKMALIRGLERWQSSGKIAEAKQLIISAYENRREKLHLELFELTSLPPEIGQLTALTHLYLSDNNLTDLPAEICQLRALTHLDLSYNELRVLPAEICQLTALQRLNLENNQLTGLPTEIGELRALHTLWVFNNRLTSLPISIGLLTNLSAFYFHHNPLSELPLSLAELHLLTYLDIEGTQISQEVMPTILAQWQAKREAEVSTLLPIKLATWKVLGESDIDLSLFDPLTGRQKFDLFEWFIRLERTRDFSNNQKHLAGVVCGMLKDVISNKEFQKIFFDQVAANNESCEDRAAMSFNEIFVSWKIICLSPDETLKEKLLLLSSAAKTNALRRFLNLAIHKSKEPQRESVEIYLYYELLLKDKLQLLTGMHEMSYGEIGKRDWINQDAIAQYVEENYFTHLFDIPIFQQLFKDDCVRKDKIEEITEFYQAKLEALPLPTNGADQLPYQVSQGEIQEERKQALMQFAKEWFDTVISKQNLKRFNLYGFGEWVWEVFKIFRAG